MSAIVNPGDSRLRRWLHLGFCAAVLFFLVAPVLVVIPLSFNAEPYFTFTEGMLRLDPDAWSLRWYRNVVEEGRWLPALGKSVLIGVSATVIATTLGTLAALGLSSPAMPGRGLVMALLISPMVTPIIITAAGMSFFYSDLGLGQTYIALILAHAVLGAPFVVISVSASLSGYNHDLNRAAANLGANWWTSLRRVQLPLIAPGVFTGALFAFAASFDEVGCRPVHRRAGSAHHPARNVVRHPRADQPGNPRRSHIPHRLRCTPDGRRQLAPPTRLRPRHLTG